MMLRRGREDKRGEGREETEDAEKGETIAQQQKANVFLLRRGKKSHD